GRLHARGGARGALPVGGAAAEAARAGHPAPAHAVARRARAADDPYRRGLASVADARARRGVHPARERRRRCRRGDGRSRAGVGRLRRVPRRAAGRRPGRATRAARLHARDPRPRGARRGPLRVTLTLVGLSHHVAPVELRERVALSPDAAAALARALGDAVCLSTCNRTEIYLAHEGADDAVAALERLAGESLEPVLYRLHDEEAAVHLFRVAAGLDSLVPGEGEILGQVRVA